MVRLSVRLDILDSKTIMRINGIRQLPRLPNDLLEECFEHACWSTLVAAKATCRGWRAPAMSVLQRQRRLLSRVLVNAAQRRHTPTAWLHAALRETPLDQFLAGEYEARVKGELWKLHTRYLAKKLVRRHRHAQVLRAVDRATDVVVDINRIHHAFDDEHDAMRTAKELELLAHFQHANIVGLYDVSRACALTGSRIYWMCEHTDTDLSYVIQSKQTLTDAHHQYLTYQIFDGLAALHAAGVVHADIKPANLYVNRDCTLRIGELGSARPPSGLLPAHADAEPYDADDGYVGRRWYRPPELLTRPADAIKPAVDVYSAGCVAVEIWLRKPLLPGRDYLHQLRLHHETMMGCFTLRHAACVTSPQALAYMQSLGTKARTFDERFAHAPHELKALLEASLAWNPAERIDARSALALPWFEPFADESGAAVPAQHSVPPPPLFAWWSGRVADRRSEDQTIEACRERVRSVARRFHELDSVDEPIAPAQQNYPRTNGA